MWLEEHEDLLAELQPDDDDMLIFTASEGKRMARVLRELGKAIDEEYKEFGLNSPIWEDLSDDAKELLDNRDYQT